MGKIHRNVGGQGAFAWEGVPTVEYGNAAGEVVKRVLVGPAEGAPSIAIRYFEVMPGSATAFDQHAHEHGVVVVRGRGRVRLGEAEHDIDPGDVVYIAPDEVHQL